MRVALIVLVACSQPAPKPTASPLDGTTWRGTSTCLVKPSPCNDEVVVYYFDDALHLRVNKIVDGEEGLMGEFQCELTASTLRCPFPKGAFIYELDGNAMHGKLDLPDGTRYRTIEVRRVR